MSFLIDGLVEIRECFLRFSLSGQRILLVRSSFVKYYCLAYSLSFNV